MNTKLAVLMGMAAALGALPTGPTNRVVISPYPQHRSKPSAPTKRERDAEQSAAKLEAAEAKRQRKAAKRLAERVEVGRE